MPRAAQRRSAAGLGRPSSGTLEAEVAEEPAAVNSTQANRWCGLLRSGLQALSLS
jgi:hypothetical protein